MRNSHLGSFGRQHSVETGPVFGNREKWKEQVWWGNGDIERDDNVTSMIISSG
jgi:hypothetical protein